MSVCVLYNPRYNKVYKGSQGHRAIRGGWVEGGRGGRGGRGGSRKTKQFCLQSTHSLTTEYGTKIYFIFIIYITHHFHNPSIGSYYTPKGSLLTALELFVVGVLWSVYCGRYVVGMWLVCG